MIILAETVLFLFTIYGFLHEDKLMAFERKVIAVIRKNAKLRKQQKAAAQQHRINEKVRYTPERPVRRQTNGNRVA